MGLKKFPHEYQMDIMDCGPACLSIICNYYRINYEIGFLRQLCKSNKIGVSIYDLKNAFESIGFNTSCLRLGWHELKDLGLPCIIHWKNSHFIVVYKITKKKVFISDPSKGLLSYTVEEFLDGWLGKDKSWVVLEIEYNSDIQKPVSQITKRKITDFYVHLSPYKKSIYSLFVLIFIITALQGLVPFITRSIIDVGIRTQDFDFLQIAIIGNILIIFSSALGVFFRDSLLVSISTRASVNIGVSYLKKLMAMPLSFFESKLSGDWLQRVTDNEKIKSFLLTHAINIVFSITSFVVFTSILFYLSKPIAFVFLIFYLAYFLWIFTLLKIKKKFDWNYAERTAKNQGFWVNTLSFFLDLKLNDFHKENLKKWQKNQAESFSDLMRVYRMNNLLNTGSSFLLQVSNQVSIYLSAKLVLQNEITFGVMIAIQILIGMIFPSVSQILAFLVEFQNVDLSFKRLNEMSFIPSEFTTENLLLVNLSSSNQISLQNIAFQYPGATDITLRGINIKFIESKFTIILGESGSGKSTLLKLVLGLYTPSFGEILVGNTNIKSINLQQWRSVFGVVTQDSKIISGTILDNITMNIDLMNFDRVKLVAEIVRLSDDIPSFNQGYNTKVGDGGRGLSGGQKQKILLARALYRDPKYLILDEATNSLDVETEVSIIDSIKANFAKCTIIMVAHRLSLSRKADIVVLMRDGLILENDAQKTLELDINSNYAKLLVENNHNN